MEDHGIFEHECEEEGCSRIVRYDDEPKCFEHSPDEGSFVIGYSAREKTIKERTDRLHTFSLHVIKERKERERRLGDVK
jgi:hypothetical protein